MKSHSIPPFPLRGVFHPVVFVAIGACLWTNVTLAQDATPAAPGAAAPAAASEVTNALPGTATDAAGTAATAADAAGKTPKISAPRDNAASPFRTGESKPGRGATKKSSYSYDTGDSETPKKKAARKFTDPEPEPETPVIRASGGEEGQNRTVVPSFYGRSPQVVTPGQGQYARPKYRYGLSVGSGYDDNPDQTPKANLGAVARPRKGSGFTYFNGHWDAQWLKPRTVFTVNLEAGGDAYWDRPGNSSDFNVRLGMLYVNKIDPRTVFSANAAFAYLSQPDYSNLYASASTVGGDYFTGSTKFDLSYRWTPQFSTVTSASVNVLKYAKDSPTQLSNSYWTFIFGNEFRFQSSKHVTWVAEARYGLDEYMDNSALNAQTAYILAGVDWIASRHVSTTFRAGASFRSFDIGGSSSAPYAELAVNYQMGRHSTLSLNGRYGYEQSTRAGDENLSYRLGLNYVQAFTSRFSGNTGFNFIHTDYSSRVGGGSTSDLYDFNVGVQYRVDRHFTIGARYSYTLQEGSTGLQDFDRNRFLISAQYEF